VSPAASIRIGTISRRRTLAAMAAVAAGAALAIAAPAIAAPATTASPAAPPAGEWRDVPLPADTTPHMWAVAAPSPRTAFAIGNHSWAQKEVTAALHWNGHAWVQRPVPPIQWNWYMDLAAAGPRAAWVTGMTLTGQKPASLHWNGSAWKQLDLPTTSGTVLWPPSVSAEPHGTAWVVTTEGADPSAPQASVLRFERGAWVRKEVPLPERAGLMDVAAQSPWDVWVGGYEADSGAYFTFHWNGREWKRHDMGPGTGGGYNKLDILALSPKNVWAYRGEGLQSLWHWDGTTWSRVTDVPRYGMLPMPYGGSIVSDGQGGIWVPPWARTPVARSATCTGTERSGPWSAALSARTTASWRPWTWPPSPARVRSGRWAPRAPATSRSSNASPPPPDRQAAA
jgi:hypothetical protein